MMAPDIALEPIFMYFSTFRWHKLVNGYSGFSPPSTSAAPRAHARFSGQASLDELRRRRCSIHHRPRVVFRLGIYQKLMARIRESPDLELVGELQWNGGVRSHAARARPRKRRRAANYCLLPPPPTARAVATSISDHCSDCPSGHCTTTAATAARRRGRRARGRRSRTGSCRPFDAPPDRRLPARSTPTRAPSANRLPDGCCSSRTWSQ